MHAFTHDHTYLLVAAEAERARVVEGVADDGAGPEGVRHGGAHALVLALHHVHRQAKLLAQGPEPRVGLLFVGYRRLFVCFGGECVSGWMDGCGACRLFCGLGSWWVGGVVFFPGGGGGIE